MKTALSKSKPLLVLISCIFSVAMIVSCEQTDKNHAFIPPKSLKITHPNDKYLYAREGKSIFEKYGTTVRWRWKDNFAGVRKPRFATPVKETLVIPLVRLFEYLWIAPYIDGAKDYKQGETFVDITLPFEILLVGSFPFDRIGRKRETAHAVGTTRIVFYNLNSYDPSSIASGLGYIRLAHHELTHSVEARYGSPTYFEQVSPRYTGAARVGGSLEALTLGMVSSYGATNPQEDLAELVAMFLTLDSVEFNQRYTTPTNCDNPQHRQIGGIFLSKEACQAINEGRQLIRQKLEIVIDYYKEQMSIDLNKVRTSIKKRRNYLHNNNNKVPEE